MTEPDEERSSILPIVLAAAIVILAMGTMWVLKFFQSDTVPDDGLVVRAVLAQNDALQRESFADFREYTCAAQQGTEQQVISDQRQSKNAKGNRFVDDIKDFAIKGDQASATVVYHFEKKPDDKLTQPMSFVRESGTWKVCSPGPR